MQVPSSAGMEHAKIAVEILPQAGIDLGVESANTIKI